MRKSQVAWSSALLKYIFITGAGQGLGHELALACARAGHQLILQGRKDDKLNALYDAIEALGTAPLPILLPLDFTKTTQEDFSNIVHSLKKEIPRLDAFIHCAAHLGNVSPIEHQQLAEWAKCWQVNTTAPVFLTRALAPLLHAAQNAKVLYCLDHHVLEPGPFWGGYQASKAALYSFSQSLRDEWSETGTQIVCIIPGPINSPLRRQTHPGENIDARIPLADAVARLLQVLEAPAPIKWCDLRRAPATHTHFHPTASSLPEHHTH
ncbi:MAG: putative oxidoreductase YciK [Pseudomonadota bacterium]|jgi:short-subunit dehydrogenase